MARTNIVGGAPSGVGTGWPRRSYLLPPFTREAAAATSKALPRHAAVAHLSHGHKEERKTYCATINVTPVAAGALFLLHNDSERIEMLNMLMRPPVYGLPPSASRELMRQASVKTKRRAQLITRKRIHARERMRVRCSFILLRMHDISAYCPLALLAVHPVFARRRVGVRRTQVRRSRRDIIRRFDTQPLLSILMEYLMDFIRIREEHDGFATLAIFA